MRGRRAAGTLIVFARKPVAGRTKTRLEPLLGSSGVAKFSEALLQDALAKAASVRGWHKVIALGGVRNPAADSWCRSVARAASAELIAQCSGDLGQRMERALATYAQGATALIGTDTPSLPVEALRRNLALLRRAHVVLGPTLDGGYYFVGVRGAVPDIFRGIEWGGSSVLKRTVDRLRELGIKYALGPAWYDVDVPEDLLMLAQHLRRRPSLTGVCPATASFLQAAGFLPEARRRRIDRSHIV